MATHDQNSEDFELRVQAYMKFFRQLGERRAAEFCAHQDATIEGLTKNNESFVRAYREAADGGGDESNLLAAARGLIEYRLHNGPLNFQLEKADTFIFRMRVALEAMGEVSGPSNPEN